jgi:2-iminoacetate synthase
MSAASRTDPGGYTKEGGSTLTQFSTSDEQTLDEVMEMVALEGYVPSLCTTCYRVGRVGNAFHEKTLSGGMERFCGANAILTLKEYLGDGHANGSRDVLLHALSSAVSDIKDEDMKKAIVERLERIEKGERDIYL